MIDQAHLEEPHLDGAHLDGAHLEEAQLDEAHPDGLSVGEVADRMHIARSAVRWYADQELLPCERTSSNQRRFYPDVLCRVAMIRASQRVGLSLAEIKEALSVLTPGVPPTPADWEAMATRLREVVNERIDHLFVLLDELDPTSRTSNPDQVRPA